MDQKLRAINRSRKKNMKTQQEIYNQIKSADNKKLWSLSKEISDTYKQLNKIKEEREREQTKQKEKGGSLLSQVINDKELLRTHVLEHLFKESSKGNAQASHRLTELVGLKLEEELPTIEVISYCGICGKKPSNKNTCAGKP
jgi:hypothetical protein